MLGAAGVECCTPLCPPFCGCVARGGGKEPRSGRLPRRLSCLAKSVRVWRCLARGLASPASLLPRPLGESGLEDFLWRNSLKNLSRLYCQLSTERYPEAFSPRLLVDVCVFLPYALSRSGSPRSSGAFPSRVLRGEYWTRALRPGGWLTSATLLQLEPRSWKGQRKVVFLI